MQLQLVYRVLRKISDWTVAGYYSDIYIDGQENVPVDGPLIIASTHHNEIIDIATLAATIPHRRHVSIWTKSTMFRNPVIGAILSSSGAIPVKRNPNNSSTNAPGVPLTRTTSPLSSSLSPSLAPEKTSTTRSAPSVKENDTKQENPSLSRSTLFKDTSKALHAHKVIGVFPEGTSYTQASIAQIMPGAAWAAVEYIRYAAENEKGQGKDIMGGRGIKTRLLIIPLAIVYTNKSKYLSRIYVRYGEPISIDDYAEELLSSEDADESSKVVVKKIMQRVEKQMRNMTINAPDWDTLCAVSMARTILWEDENNVPLKDWVDVSQKLIAVFSSSNESINDLKRSLTRYYALLHYANVRHPILQSLLPVPASSTSALLDVTPAHIDLMSSTLLHPTLSLLYTFPISIISFILFIPPLLLHLPGYLAGHLLMSLLATPEEEETLAEHKNIGAGLGIGLNVLLAVGMLWRRSGLEKVATGERLSTLTQKISGIVGTVYISVLLLVKWHKLLVFANYKELQRYLTYRKLLSAFAFYDDSEKLTPTQLEAYSKPPLPPVNVFIKKKSREGSAATGPNTSTNQSNSGGSSDKQDRSAPPPVSSKKLMRPLLHARVVAFNVLHNYLATTEGEILVKYLDEKGAKITTVRNTR